LWQKISAWVALCQLAKDLLNDWNDLLNSTASRSPYGHTGNIAGYTQFISATADGKRSATVSINAQITPELNPVRFAELRQLYELAVCAALD
jgi:hypothetical protein